MTSSKVILRQSRLQYDSQSCVKESDNSVNSSPFTLNISTSSVGFTQNQGKANLEKKK